MSDPAPNPSPVDPTLERYSRQILFDQIGEEGQRKLLGAHVTLIGCGALGTVLANTLVRAGIGHLRICDRDYIERDNLQRQILFDEDDIASNLPKAEAATRKLRRINPEVEVEGVITDVNHTNIERLAADADLLLDGTDNFETRYLMNDLAVKTHRPWIYGAVISATGLCMPILPNDTPCLRCVFETAPPPEMTPTCDTVGVLGPVVNIVAGFQALEAMKILAGRVDAVNRHLVNIDGWSGRITNLKVQRSYDEGNCPCCKQRRFEYLDGKMASSVTTLCGRDAVQINRGDPTKLDLAAIADRLRPGVDGEVRVNKFMLRCSVGKYDLTLFADGRAIVKGTADADKARTLYAKYIGG